MVDQAEDTTSGLEDSSKQTESLKELRVSKLYRSDPQLKEAAYRNLALSMEVFSKKL